MRARDHIVQGVKLVTSFIQSEKLDSIIHIVANHHAEKNWGSPVQPRTPEAWMIHTMDNLSSKIMG